jgi:sugar lactone lactonase YvrE
MNGKIGSYLIVAMLLSSLILSGCQPIQRPASSEEAQPTMETIAEGFNSPQGVLVDADGNVWVIDSGVGGEEKLSIINPQSGEPVEAPFGESARVVKIDAQGEQHEIVKLPSVATGQDTIGGARLAQLNGVLYATSGGWMGDPSSKPQLNMAVVAKVEESSATAVADLWAAEVSQNPDPNLLDSHPYGLTAGPDGMLYVSDAGGNALYKVEPATGAAEVVAIFAGLPGPFPNPLRGNAQETDPVPTAAAFDADGNLYVSLLSGFPFIPGSAKVLKVEDGGTVSDYAAGLTTLTDLRTGPDGQMYAVQFGIFSEQGPTPNSGAIIRIKAGNASEVVLDGLSFPVSLDFNAAGDAYIAINGVGAPGSGAVVKIVGLTSMAGKALGQ